MILMFTMIDNESERERRYSLLFYSEETRDINQSSKKLTHLQAPLSFSSVIYHLFIYVLTSVCSVTNALFTVNALSTPIVMSKCAKTGSHIS